MSTKKQLEERHQNNQAWNKFWEKNGGMNPNNPYLDLAEELNEQK